MGVQVGTWGRFAGLRGSRNGRRPLSIYYVEATVYEATREQAAEFLGYVGGLAFEEPEPVNIRAWVRGNVPSGGQLTAGGAEVTLYGTTEVRTLVVAGVPQAVPAAGTTVPGSEGDSPGAVPNELDPDESDLDESGFGGDEGTN